MPRIAWFVSPHGFGHAARSCAVMERLHELAPDVEFDIFTTVPRWFFDSSLTVPFTYHEHRSDIGLVQRSALEEDLEATAALLDQTDLLSPATIYELAVRIAEIGCRAVVADIAPQGLAAARRAGLPAVLLENFTWDWIYRSFDSVPAGLTRWAGIFQSEFDRCDLRIQAEPWCLRVDDAVRVAPISRRPRLDRRTVRRALGIEGDQPMILVSMGGIPWRFEGLERVADTGGITIVVPGAGEVEERRGSLIQLPHHSRFHHPDLLHAADGVVAKLGYSTLAEVHSAGCPLGWISRPAFPESPVLERWVSGHLAGFEITAGEITEGTWIRRLPELLALRRRPDRGTDGAAEAARLILERVTGSGDEVVP